MENLDKAPGANPKMIEINGSKTLDIEALGTVARYCTLTTKALVYVSVEANGRPFTDLFGERVWFKIGARQAFMVGLGAGGVAGANDLNYTMLIDLARYALIFIASWKVVSNPEVISPKVLKALQTSGSHKAYLRRLHPALQGSRRLRHVYAGLCFPAV